MCVFSSSINPFKSKPLMPEKKAIKIYGSIIDTLSNYSKFNMPLLSEEQAMLARGIKTLSTCRSVQAKLYVREAERLLSLS